MKKKKKKEKNHLLQDISQDDPNSSNHPQSNRLTKPP